MSIASLHQISLDFLIASIICSALVFCVLFIRSTQRRKHAFQFVVLFEIICWQASMLWSFTVSAKLSFVADATSYALAFLGVMLLFLFSRKILHRSLGSWNIIMALLPTVICFVPGAVVGFRFYINPTEYELPLGLFAPLYYLVVVALLVLCVKQFMRVRGAQYFSTARSSVIALSAFCIVNVLFNICTPLLFILLGEQRRDFSDALQAFATAFSSIVFMTIFYVSIAYEYMSVRLSIQKKIVQWMLNCLLFFATIFTVYALLVFFDYQIIVYVFALGLGYIVMYYGYRYIDYFVDLFFFFDRFDSDATHMRAIDGKLADMSTENLKESLLEEYAKVGLQLQSVFLFYRDQYMFKDVLTNRRIREMDPCVGALHHLKESIVNKDAIALFRHRYMNTLHRFMIKRNATMLAILKENGAVIGFVLFSAEDEKVLNEKQRKVINSSEQRAAMYLLNRESLFASLKR